jgi:hypothetical protein
VPAENMAQLQAGLLVSGREWIDYISYCGGMPLWVKRVEPDPGGSTPSTAAVIAVRGDRRRDGRGLRDRHRRDAHDRARRRDGDGDVTADGPDRHDRPPERPAQREDLLSGPRTVTITEVRKGSVEQPVDIHLAEFPGRPFKPSKTVRRILVAAWGPDASAYAGRRITLYRDPAVRFGGMDVGGIRVSHLSHIAKPMTLVLAVSKGKRAPYVVQPLADAPRRSPSCRRTASSVPSTTGSCASASPTARPSWRRSVRSSTARLRRRRNSPPPKPPPSSTGSSTRSRPTPSRRCPRAGGRRWVLGAIAVGTVVSLLMGTGVIAFAAAVAFAVSELLDWLTYRALRGNFLAAVAVSGVVGLLVDSLLFCWLAFGDLTFVPGQILGKAYALAAVVVLLYVTRRRVTA